ncbi:c-type cytochrome [Pontibaca salina]|uniref:Cytochrome c n=1 Tax=Pontibaca salina TaxID=2795731 RepID=A0A934M1V4_9RHOB|nr:cytochrome c [Pontibaca salina]MBI6630011.1 cytochrome c [Pontibaca salina]
MKNTFITTLILGAFAALPLQAQSTDQGAEKEIKPEEAMITEMADEGADWNDEYTSTDGEELYQTLCAGCHMSDGSGAEGGGHYPALSGNPNLEFSGYATHVIVNGQAGMPSLGHFLDDEQVVAITDYIQTNLGNDYEPDGTVEAVADVRPDDPADQNAEEHE